MPRLIEPIDAIARKKRRGVLFLTFHLENSEVGQWRELEGYDYQKDGVREEICQWLTDHEFGWEPCAPIASENMLCGYLGQIYIDLPFDKADPGYGLVRDYLEFPNGRMRYPTVSLWYLSLEKAMENAHHDEPGFWDKWAETF